MMKLPFVTAAFLSAAILFSGTGFSGQNPSQKIDSILAKSWKEKGVEPGKRIDDQTFVRRIYLDIAGRIPTAEEIRAFEAGKSKNKRAELVDELLDSEGYVNNMFNFWADILRVHSQQGGGQNVAPQYIDFVKDSLRENKPYDQFVYELVTAEGSSYQNGAIGYYYRDRNMPLDNMANTVRVFLGTRLECAQCHNHPFDKWTQMDFYHMAAFTYGVSTQNRQGSNIFQEIQRKMNANRDMDRDLKRSMQRALQEIRRPVRNNVSVGYRDDRLPQLPHDYQYSDAKPKEKITEKVMFGVDPEITSPGERLTKYAEWMTSPENPRFTKVIANRLWKQAMGLGLVEPVDEFVDSTTAANPDLFTFLEEEMKRQDYDIKSFLRMNYNTDVNQREAVADEIYVPSEYAFTGPVMRRMTAEQIWDSVVVLVNPKPDLGNWRRQQETMIRNAGSEMLSKALKSKGEEELMRDVKKIAALQKNLQKRTIELQEAQAEARKNKDQEKVRELAQEARQVQNKLRRQVYTQVYQPALKKAKVETVSFELPEGMGTFEMKMDPTKIDQNGRLTNSAFRELEKKEEELFVKDMKSAGLDPEDQKQRRGYVGFRKNVSQNFARAANLSSPAPPGHFLRQFGQSDRETIENAEQAASVPQALTMLNGPLFQTIVNQQTVLVREVEKANTTEEKIDAIYLSLLGRTPDQDEKEVILADAETRGDKLYQDVVFALMNTQEFYFVQ
ncbi:MAG: DUF1549 domain-containing protein [Verrucomicrobiales bacterium]|nr:DUF1549 domain-containing protein [Verrucomicrobiales bacterium]